MYHYYQIEGGQEAWKPVPALYLDRVIAEKNPMFVTVLATDRLVSRETPRDEKLLVKYYGPLYFDFDSADIADVIADLKTFSVMLQNLGLNPDYPRFYITGNKGFHVEIPLE